MARRRIDQLTPGEDVVLRFHTSTKLAEYEEPATFQGIIGSGADRLARFESRSEDGHGTEVWDAYRYKGGWAYGTGADHLSLVLPR